MPTFDHGDATIHYDDEGSGDGEPVLLLAPGGMRSANRAWDGTPWNPRTALADLYRLIGMDQRNAGDSRAPVRAGDGWDDYAGDQLALLDHLGIERCHLVGMCIGGPFALALLATDPKRFASAALLQPVGVDDNTDTLHEMFDGWAREVADDHPEASAADWKAFRRNLWDGDFVLSVTTDQVSACATPLLVLMGADVYHPEAISREIVDLAPDATLVERWKEPEHLAATDDAIKGFLADHPA